MNKALKIIMGASLLITGAPAFAAEGDGQKRQQAGQPYAGESSGQARVEVCFDQPEAFRSLHHNESGFARPGKFESALN